MPISNDMPETSQKVRFAHFRFDPVKDMLGEGPLSEVYRAEDEKLQRTIALKILRSHVELDPEADQRFEREARHTSNLAHPNIATIYEYGEDAGRRFIAMEYLQGRTLDKIIKDQQLGVEEGLRIAIQLTSALALVHKSGLIHRDLKPANVMVLHDGTIKLLDFGIARANGESTITQHGMLVGTVLYMSPEQVRGDELDARSDIFSLGAMLYHALSGQLPFPGTSFPEVCMAILDGKPRSLSTIRSGLPQALADFIMRCMQHDPAQRYPNAEIAHGALLAIADSLAPSHAPERAAYLSGHLAVTPIRCSGSAGAQGLAAGIRKDIAAELQRAGMTVTVMSDVNVPSDLHADFTLRGELAIDGAKASLQLILEHYKAQDLTQTREVWRDRIELVDADEWALQASFVRTSVRSLRRQLAEHSMPTEEPRARDPEAARQHALRGHEVLHRGMTKHLLASISLFRRAIEADSHCALGYAGLAEALVRKYLYWDGDQSFLVESRENARRALSIDVNCAEAHTSLGFGYHMTGLSVDAQREYRLAIQINQQEWLAHRLLGALLTREGNFKAASPLLQRAIAIRPTYISSYDHLYQVLVRLDRYQEAIETADRGIAAGRKQVQRVPDDQDSRLHLALLLARMGLRDESLAELARAHEIGPKDGFTSFQIASTHAVLGDPDEAIAALSNAQSRGYYIKSEQRNSEFDLLRGLPAFQALVQ
jgi:tetratricopeptide (TPR) repeat protein/tRNA A-37 threonylcarbamoyl transferase component Bud32